VEHTRNSTATIRDRRSATALIMSSSQPQAGGAGQQQQQQQGAKLLKADDILRLQCLTDDEKQKYRLLMHNTWNMFNNATPGSPEQIQARTTLQQFSQKFIARERAHRAKIQQQQQGGQTQPNQAGSGAQQAPVKQEGQGNAADTTANQQQQQPSQGQNQTQQRSQNSSVDPSIIKHVQEFPFTLPPNFTLATPEAEAKMKEYKNGYLNMLAKQATLTENIKRIQAQMQERQKSGQEVPQELTNAKNKVEEEYYRMKAQIEKFRGLQKQWKDERGNQGQGAQPAQQSQQPQQTPPQQSQQGQQPQQPQRQPSLSGPSGQPAIKEEPQIKVEGGQSQQQQTQPQQPPQFNQQQNNQQQPPQQNAQGPPQQLQQQQQQQQQQPGQQQMQPGQQQMQPGQQQMQQGQQQMQRPPPAPHSLSMSQQPQFPQQGQQQHLQQQGQPRPQINPHQANMQQHQQSNSPHPQSATTNGQPVPLSHQAAISAANRSYTDPARTNTPMQAGAGGSFHAPGSREREQLNNPKMPIPRHLNVTSPMPVNMGQQRPTMSGPTNGAPGPMGQPVISRPPPFQLEGEGDRVLSKRKLDELVRQVTGGSEEALTPEVEDVRCPVRTMMQYTQC
jgi:transcription initiation factor TFIID subunit 12